MAKSGRDKEADRRRRVRAGLVAWARKAVNELGADEQASLVAAAPRLLAKRIPPEHEARLIDLGLGERKLGGFTLTPLGHAAARILGSGA